MLLDFSAGARVLADAGYTDYETEDLLATAGVTLPAGRKHNSHRSRPGWMTYRCQHAQKRIETTFSQIAGRLARSLHAVTSQGFELKVFLTVLAIASRHRWQLGL